MKHILLHIGNVTKKDIPSQEFWLNDNQHPTLLIADVIVRLKSGQETFVTNNTGVLSYFTCLLQACRLNCMHIRPEYKTFIDSVDIIQYELDGTCATLSKYKDWMPTDENVCNVALCEFNDWYSHLLDYEDSIKIIPKI